MEVIAAHPNYELGYHAGAHVIKLLFLGDMSDEIYKEFWTKAIDFGIQKNCNRVIIDQSQIGNVSFNARGWVVVNAFPRIKKSMPKSLAGAVIASSRVVQKTGVQYLMKAFKGLTGYQVEMFPNDEEAIAWLSQANEVVLPGEAVKANSNSV